jgi:hypothetical protein
MQSKRPPLDTSIATKEGGNNNFLKKSGQGSMLLNPLDDPNNEQSKSSHIFKTGT